MSCVSTLVGSFVSLEVVHADARPVAGFENGYSSFTSVNQFSQVNIHFENEFKFS